MADVNEVITWLGCLMTKQHKCAGCPYNPHPGMDWVYGCMAGQGKIVEDARKLLTHQAESIASLEGTIVKLTEAISATAPRILTLEEAEEADVCWLEGRSVERIIPCRLHIYAGSITATIMKMIASPEDLFLEYYGIEWRCWSGRPSNRQRREAKWNE